jgi:porphobilinogen synthase
MPGVERLSVDQAVRDAERAAKLNIPCIALFPYTEPDSLRDEHGSEALNPDNLVCQRCAPSRRNFPRSACSATWRSIPITSHGHDGLIEDGRILNDETVAVLVRQALVQAEAGCDIIAPSDMMDGRVGAIREGSTRRLPRRADHGLCGEIRLGLLRPVPRRGRLGQDADRRQAHLSDGPGQFRRGLREVELDIAEGADMVMVKPGLPYLDIVRRVKDTFAMPTFAYQVSGEYAMIMAAAGNGWLDGDGR